MPSLPGGRSYGLARWEGGLPALHEDRMSSFPARVPCASGRRNRRLRQEPLPLVPDNDCISHGVIAPFPLRSATPVRAMVSLLSWSAR